MFQFEPVSLPPEAEALRLEVRRFIEAQLPVDYLRNSDFNAGESADLSRKLGQQGWIGMTWPKQYGGAERSFLERYVVTEELLAAGAPVGAHWIADRQSGPQFLKFGTESQRQKYLPAITRGECYFSIGMSEPDSGSDLASIRSMAKKTEGGWLLNGSKIWTSGAHMNHYMIALVRTEPASENRHAGMSQVIVDLADANVTITGIKNLAGDTDFNQVFFDDVFISDEHVVGQPGNGWEQVMSELGFERSGPERFLSAFRVLVEFIREVGTDPTDEQAALVGRLVAHLITLRRMSVSVAGMLQAGKMPTVEAALIKDLGNSYERMVPEIIRQLTPGEVSSRFVDTLNQCILHAPSFTLRGGTREILRGMIARGLGLR
jgi:acyl-CoA dehydrogenase